MKQLVIIALSASLVVYGCGGTDSGSSTDAVVSDTGSNSDSSPPPADTDPRTDDGPPRADTTPAPDTGPPPPTPTSVTLTHLATSEMVEGTHRPELVIKPDGGLMVAVVHPDGKPTEVGSIKHKAYSLDAEGKVSSDGFALTTTTAEYGEPADHRVLVVGDELVVVYQTLIFTDDKPTQPSGPAEQYTESQSLMLARFTFDGTETFRGPIVDKATDFAEDNFPDHCMAFNGDSLIVSTGSTSKQLKFRVVSLTGEVTKTVSVAIGLNTVGADIGNSLFWRDSQLMIASGRTGGPNDAKPVLFALVSDQFDITPLAEHAPEGEDTIFPTGTLVRNGITYIAYSVHAAGGSPDIETNPYHPKVAAFDDDWKLLTDVTVSEEPGAGHVHPTVVAVGNTLYYAWSRKKESSGMGPNPPQVLIERYTIDAK